MAKKHLFLFTIGPVQSFIAQARKLQDLAAGSAILSNLMRVVYDNVQGTIIFPQSTGTDSSLSHRLLAIVTQDDIKTFGDGLVAKVTKELETIAQCVSTKQEAELQKHIQDALQCYWVAIPIENDNISTQEYQRIEQLLSSAKNTRSFSQLVEPAARKCNLCGERNALFVAPSASGSKPQYADEAELWKGNLLKQNEGLCGVCMTKRTYDINVPSTYINNPDTYPSTANVAMAYSLKAKDSIELANFKKLFKDDWDDEFWFKDNLIGDAKKHIEKLKRLNLHEEDHYVLLNLDVDSLGTRMSSLSDNKERIKLSKALASFAEKAQKEINENLGITIYAGGDDFLALLNLNGLFNRIEKLKEHFHKYVNKKMEFRNYEELSFSVGLVIAHYKTPLNEVLHKARELVKEAKDYAHNGTKAGIGILYLSRASTLAKTVFQHKDLDILTRLLDKLIRKEINLGFFNTFSRSVGQTAGEILVETDRSLFVSAFRHEFERLAGRAAVKESAELKVLALEVYDNILLGDLARSEGRIDIDNLLGFGKTAEKLYGHRNTMQA